MPSFHQLPFSWRAQYALERKTKLPRAHLVVLSPGKLGHRTLTPGEVLCKNKDGDTWRPGRATEPTCARCVEFAQQILQTTPKKAKK